jgi:hypothetical protein
MIIPFGFYKSGAKIVTDQIAFYADANGYTSGNTWTDISGNNTNMTLFNTPTKISDVGGAIRFLRSSNQYSRVTLSSVGTSSPNVITVEFWAKLKNDLFLGAFMPAQFQDYTFFVNNNGVGFNTFNGDTYGVTTTNFINAGHFDNWRHYALVFNQNISYTNNKIYINGTTLSISQIFGSENAANRNFGNGLFSLNGNGSLPSDLDVAVCRIYRKELSLAEVTNNYNLEKQRFGL